MNNYAAVNLLWIWCFFSSLKHLSVKDSKWSWPTVLPTETTDHWPYSRRGMCHCLWLKNTVYRPLSKSPYLIISLYIATTVIHDILHLIHHLLGCSYRRRWVSRRPRPWLSFSDRFYEILCPEWVLGPGPDSRPQTGSTRSCVQNGC